MRKEMREKFETLNLKLDSLSLRSRTSGEQEKQPPGSQSDVGLEQKFHCARNIQDLMELEIGLQYDETRNEMFCPCSTQSYFKCPDPEVEALDSDIEDGDQDLVSSQFRQFRNLKKSLKRHMETAGHKTYLIEERRAEEETRKYLSRNLAAGQTLGRIVYMLVKLGRPFQDYEEQVLTAKIGGSEVGKDFATKLLRPLSAVVTEDLKNFFSTPLIQTGFRPKLTLSADGATHKHYTRQFIACVTINPDGENFLETVSIGQPILREGSTGIKLTENIKTSLDEFGIHFSQISSMSCDGVCIARHIQQLFEDQCGAPPGSIPMSHDWLHQLGLIDKNVSKLPEFNWLATITDVCSSVYHLFNWGNLAARLQTQTQDQGLVFKQLQTFSATRFANSRYLVYKNLLDMIVPICSVLEEDITKDEENKSRSLQGIERRHPGVKKRGADALEVKSKLFNRDTLLRLAGVVSIYSVFSKIVKVVQMVHLLPFQRFDAFKSAVTELEEMVDIKSKNFNCYHVVKQSLEESGKIQGLEIPEKFPKAAPNSFLWTRHMRATEESHQDQDLVQKCEDDLTRLAEKLSSRMSNLVSESELERIEAGRQILDVQKILTDRFVGL